MSNSIRSLLLALALGLVVFAIGVSGVFARPAVMSPTVFLPFVALGAATPAAYVGGPIPLSAPMNHISKGASVPFGPSGFAIVANSGPAYRLVWTAGNSSAARHRFYGSIWTTGTFTSVVPGCIDKSCPIGAHGVVSTPVDVAGGQRVDFDTNPGTAVIGLDFFLSADPAYFDLFVDGARDPNLVYFPSAIIGGAVSNVEVIPFQFTVQ